MQHLRVLFIWVYLIGLFSPSASAWGFPGGSVHHEMPLPSSAPPNLLDGAGLVTFAKANQFMRSLDKASSCARQAASGLIKDCSNFDSTDSGGHFALDAVKSLYAVRLAICEIKDANINVPGQCDIAVLEGSSADALKVKGGTSKAVEACVKALYTLPQSWTSYSNNIQNVRLICQATRPEAEREEMVAMFKSLVNNQEASAETLLQQIQFSKKHLAEQKVLADEIMVFSRDMADQMRGAFQEALAGFAQLQTQAGATQAEYTQFFNELMLHTKGEMKSVVQKSIIREASLDITKMVSHLDVQGQEVSSQWRQNIDTNTQLEIQAQNRLGALVNDTNFFREEIGDLRSLVSETKANLDGLSASVGIISTLHRSFKSWLGWILVAAAVVVSLVISLAFFGVKGVGLTTMTIACIAFVYVLGHELGRISSWRPLTSPSNLPSPKIDMLWKATSFVVLAGVVAILYQACTCRSVRSLFKRSQRRPTQELPTSHYTPIQPQPIRPARPFHYYHPSTQSFLNEDDEFCDDLGL